MILKGACTALIGTGPEMILVLMALNHMLRLLCSSLLRSIQPDIIEVHLT